MSTATDYEYDHGPNCDCESRGDPRSMDVLDECLTVWIFDATALGVGLGYVEPYFQRRFDWSEQSTVTSRSSDTDPTTGD